MDASEQKSWDRFLGKSVVVDTSTPLMYLGTLREVDDTFLVLETADVHDRTEGHSTNELYALEARRTGVRANRRCVAVRKAMVASVALLDDIIPY
jgi:small nuclear ribonucleoprotein (snRNP)-like protein